MAETETNLKVSTIKNFEINSWNYRDYLNLKNLVNQFFKESVKKLNYVLLHESISTLFKIICTVVIW